MFREPQKMFAVLGGSATSVVRCGLVNVTTLVDTDDLGYCWILLRRPT